MVGQDSVDLDNPKVLRASAGQWFRLPMQVNNASDGNQGKTSGYAVTRNFTGCKSDFLADRFGENQV